MNNNVIVEVGVRGMEVGEGIERINGDGKNKIEVTNINLKETSIYIYLFLYLLDPPCKLLTFYL